MTLDMELKVPEYNAKLYYDNSRPPNEAMVKKICESLDLARDIMDEAFTKLSYALINPKLHARLQALWKDASIPDIRVAKEAALYHFLINGPSPSKEFKRIMTVIKDTRDGLKALNGGVTLSDVLSQYGGDLYKGVREKLAGKLRPKSEDQRTADQPTADELRSGYVLFKYSLGGYLTARFSPDRQRVVFVSKDQSAQVWDAATQQAFVKPMQHKGGVLSAQFSRDGQQVVTASEDDTARVWDAAAGRAISQPMKHSSEVYSGQFSPDGKRVVTASEDGKVQVWDAATGQAVGQPMQHKGAVLSAQFSADRKRVVTASDDETAQVWDAATGQAVGQPMQHDDEVHSAQFSADGQHVVTTAADDKMEKERVWNAETGEALGELQGPVYFTPMCIPKGIHIEFSNVTKYPRLLLALAIVHEATHKFAHTEDHAYTDDDNYKKLIVAQRIENADSFAYVAISIFLNQLIKDLEEFLKAVPRDDQRGPKTARSWPMDILGRATTRPRKT